MVTGVADWIEHHLSQSSSPASASLTGGSIGIGAKERIRDLPQPLALVGENRTGRHTPESDPPDQ